MKTESYSYMYSCETMPMQCKRLATLCMIDKLFENFEIFLFNTNTETKRGLDDAKIVEL